MLQQKVTGAERQGDVIKVNVENVKGDKKQEVGDR